MIVVVTALLFRGLLVRIEQPYIASILLSGLFRQLPPGVKEQEGLGFKLVVSVEHSPLPQSYGEDRHFMIVAPLHHSEAVRR